MKKKRTSRDSSKAPMTAADMGRKRWAGVSKEERTAFSKRAIEIREAKRRWQKELVQRYQTLDKQR